MQKKIDKWKNSGKTDKLIKVLTDENFKNRIGALKALGELGDNRTIDDIRKLLKDPVKAVVFEAAETLKMLGIDQETKLEIEKILANINELEAKKAEKRQETWREKTEEEKQEDLEKRAKMIGIHQIEKEALAVQRKNGKQKAITGTIANIFGTKRR